MKNSALQMQIEEVIPSEITNKETFESKFFGKVYTPKFIVDQMLNEIFSKEMSNKLICDPACGTGDFLLPIASRLCDLILDIPSKRKGLELSLKNLTGFDIDSEAVKNCKKRLSKLVQHKLKKAWREDDWEIYHFDALDSVNIFSNKFDVIIGNPPYVRVQNLEKSRRNKIKSGNWKYYVGSSDLYIVFFELGLKLLKKKGQLIYISPSGWMRNKAGSIMRENISNNHYLVSIYDFKEFQVFDKVSTYTCITHIIKASKQLHLPKVKIHNKPKQYNYQFVNNNSKWGILPKTFASKVAKSKKYNTLGELANVQVGIQTLADNVFIMPVIKTHKNYVICNVKDEFIKIEKKITKRILKASVIKSGRDPINRVIIYPYSKEGELISERDFKNKYPNAYKWLLRNKKRLLLRDKGQFDPNIWYAFGREVSIKSGFGKKIITSGINRKPNFQYCDDPDTLFYSGYCIKPHNEINTKELLKQINSERMFLYISAFSQPFRSGWFSYAKQYIQNFPLTSDVLKNGKF